MGNPRRWAFCMIAVGLLLACGSGSEQSGAIGTVTESISACDETVPMTRFIDGFPAYAQCATTENSAIYSNNGIDTATVSMGADWVRTQHSGGYQCTELAHRYLLFKWHVTWLPSGNAGQWCDTMPTATSGVVQTMTPVHGDLMVFAPGSCGADGTAGHVAVVDVVGAPGAKLSAVQQNVASRSSYAPSCAKCFLHVVANDGSVGANGSGGNAGTGGALAGSGGLSGSGGFGPGGAAGQFTMGTGGAPVVPPGTGGSAPVVQPPAAPSSGAASAGGSAGASGVTALPGVNASGGETAEPPAKNDPSLSCRVGRAGSRTSAGDLALALLLIPLSFRRSGSRRKTLARSA